MARLSKTESDEIWERLDELDGGIRAIRLVLIRHIFRCDWVLRGHAHSLAERIEEDIAATPVIPPNENLRRCLVHLVEQIRQTAEIIDSIPMRQDGD